MPLFQRKNNKKGQPKEKSVVTTDAEANSIEVSKRASKPTSVQFSVSLTSEAIENPSAIVLRPRITEKGAVIASESNAYTFEVARRATKPEINAAIQKIYKVTPIKIRIAQVPDKKVRIRGERSKSGIKSGGKKAFVYLKKGDKIEFV